MENVPSVQRDTTPDSLIIGNVNDIPIISLSDSDLDSGDDFENISGLLSASNDLFSNTAAFNFGTGRFRMRGYQSNSAQVYLNGSSMNDLETGGVYWSAWGGLNDVLRNREVTMGLAPSAYAFGGINGSTNIDIGAASQREQKRISYASSNRSYFHRIMGVYTPNLKNDWYLTLSGSRRWAKEGYQEGTFYDSWSYFFGVEKKFADRKQSVAFNVFASPTQRGRSSASTEEMYAIAGSNFYNPNWGYQNGEKRNSRVNNSHQPVMVLQHKWELKKNSNLNTSVSYQFGRNGGSALERNGARDARPDYYKNLPSYIQDPTLSQQVYDAMSADENLRQLDWNNLYQSNFLSDPTTIFNADNIDGNNVTGLQSKYILEDRRYDKKKLDVNINYNKVIGESFTLSSGLSYGRQNTHNHKRVLDLLGGDFYLDIDRFAERDNPGDDNVIQSDLNNPNNVVREGDVFGYSYDSNIQSTKAWVQGKMDLDKFDIFAAINVGHTQFWRTGNFKNGLAPDNSFGDSEKQNFIEYGAKLGATYKLDGRNYFFANGSIVARPPSYRESYLSPRTRDWVVPNLTTEKIKTVEGGYYFKSPYYKARVTGYYTKFKDGVDVINFYNDAENTFGSLTRTGVDRQHFGVEIAGEAQIVTGLSVVGVVALGQYTYTNRPQSIFVQDNDVSFSQTIEQTVYQKNFYIHNTPQRAYSVGLKYNSPKRWFANVNFNYFDEMYLDFNPLTRTTNGVTFAGLQPGTEAWTDAISQRELDTQYSLDLFGGKSWNINYKYYVFITVGVSNVLNNKQFATGGYEQLRNAAQGVNRAFDDRIYYATGINYFAQVAFRF